MDGEHKPVPVHSGADQSHPKGRRVGEIADRGALGRAQPLDLLLDIDDAARPARHTAKAPSGSAGMICTGCVELCIGIGPPGWDAG